MHTTRIAVSVLLLAVFAATAAGDTLDPTFVKKSGTEAIAEFRSNGDGSSWSFGTGIDTHTTGEFIHDDMVFEGDLNWEGNATYDWTFSVSAGVPTLTVDGIGLSWEDGLTDDILSATTVQIHAKDAVTFTYDFGSYGSGSLEGSTEDRWGVDYFYIDVGAAGLNGLMGSGTITFEAPVGKQSTSGVTFKAGDRSPVPEPGTMALVASAIGAMWVRRRSR